MPLLFAGSLIVLRLRLVVFLKKAWKNLGPVSTIPVYNGVHSAKQANSSKKQFPALTGIRALGAMAVFFVHLPFALGHRISIDVMAFFFVLSGFLIVYLYYEDVRVKQWKLKRYFVNRFARIYPVYFLLVTIAILLLHDFRPWFLFKSFTITHSFFQNNRDLAIKPSWSITTEETFYFFAPCFILLIRRFNYFIALLSGGLLLVAALFISILPISFLHTPRFVFSITFFGHFFEFFCGIYLALLILKSKNKTIDLPGKKFTVIGTAGVLLTMGILIASNNMNDQSRQGQFILVNNFLLPVSVALFYYGLIREQTRTARFLSSPLLQILGRTSYSFYLVHMIVIDFIATPFMAPAFVHHYNLYVILIFILAQLIAFLIFRFYEEPANILIRQKFGRKLRAAGPYQTSHATDDEKVANYT